MNIGYSSKTGKQARDIGQVSGKRVCVDQTNRGKSPRTVEFYSENIKRFLWYCSKQNWPDDIYRWILIAVLQGTALGRRLLLWH